MRIRTLAQTHAKLADEHRKRWAWRNLVQIYLGIPPHASFRPNVSDIHRRISVDRNVAR